MHKEWRFSAAHLWVQKLPLNPVFHFSVSMQLPFPSLDLPKLNKHTGVKSSTNIPTITTTIHHRRGKAMVRIYTFTIFTFAFPAHVINFSIRYLLAHHGICQNPANRLKLGLQPTSPKWILINGYNLKVSLYFLEIIPLFLLHITTFLLRRSLAHHAFGQNSPNRLSWVTKPHSHHHGYNTQGWVQLEGVVLYLSVFTILCHRSLFNLIRHLFAHHRSWTFYPHHWNADKDAHKQAQLEG